MDDQETRFLNNSAPFFKSIGQGETAGKIIGLLMVGKEYQYTLDMISDEIGRSKSTVYNSIKHLLEIGLVEQDLDDSQPSEGRYPHLYKFKEDFWALRLKKMDIISQFKDLIGDCLQILESRDPSDPRVENLSRMYGLYAYFEKRLPDLINEWEELVESGEYKQYLIGIKS